MHRACYLFRFSRFSRYWAFSIVCSAWPVLAMEMQLGMAVKLASPTTLPPLSVTVSEDTRFNDYFNRCGPGWTGGDSTYSTPLPDSKILWLFSDTFIGPVGKDGKRDTETAMFVQGNTLALQDTSTGTLTSYLRNTVNKTTEIQSLPSFSLPSFAGLPYDNAHCPAEHFIQKKDAVAMFQPPQCPSARHCYYWGGAIIADKKQLFTFLQLMEQTSAGAGTETGAFDFAWHNSAMATLPVDNIGSAEPLYINVPNNGVSYGGAVMNGTVMNDDEKYIYIYGMRAEPAGNLLCTGHCIHISRVPKEQLAQMEKWRYWGKISSHPVQYGWTENAGDSVPMTGSTSMAAAPQTQDQLGVTKVLKCGKLAECYVMIGHQYTGGFTENILAWYAELPQGPWTGPVFVYKTPESSQPGQLFTYNAKIHPEFTNEKGLLISYDVNSLAPFTDPLNAFITAASYRPRFIRVKLNWETTQQ